MRIEHTTSQIKPGCIFHSINSPEILFIVEGVGRHAQDCSHNMVIYRSITPTRDAPIGTLWTLDKTIFNKRMVQLSDTKQLDALWDGQWTLPGIECGLKVLSFLAKTVLSIISVSDEAPGIILKRSACLLMPQEIKALSRMIL